MNNSDKLRWYHGLMAIGIAVSVLFVFGIAFYLVSHSLAKAGIWTMPSFQDQPPWFISAQLLVSQGIFWLALIVSLKISGVTLKESTYQKRTSAQAIILGVVGVVAMGLLADQVTAWATQLAPELFDRGLIARLAGIFQKASLPEYVMLSFLIVLAPAFAEEFLFRGFFLRSARNSLKPLSALLLTSFLFGFVHFDFFQGLGAGLLGLWLGYLVLCTGSIWPAVIAHGANNLLVTLVTRFDSEGLGNAAFAGHPPLVLIGALVITGGCAYGVWIISKKVDYKSSS